MKKIWLIGVAFVAACAQGEYFKVEPLPGAKPTENIIVVYTHGSIAARKPDACGLGHNNRSSGTPNIVENLDGAVIGDRTVRVHKFCTPSRTGQPLSSLGDDLGPSKVMRRTFDLIKLSKAYQRAGFKPDQIVFTGQSAGGFASLLAQAASPQTIGRVIAFGPAFANKRVDRSSGEERANVILKKRLADAKGLNALVYGYDKDVYERPQDFDGLVEK